LKSATSFHELSIADLTSPEGSLAPPGVIRSQKKLWFQWPPRLFFTCCLDLQRDVSGIDQRLLDRGGAELGHLLGEFVARVDVGRVMPVVVDHHGLRVDVRLERLVGIAERRQLERAVGRGLGLSECERRDGEAAAARAEPSSSGFRVCSWLVSL
jgi:hypothetical protein